MSDRRRAIVVSVALSAAGLAVASAAGRSIRVRGLVEGRSEPGGRLIGDAGRYDLGSRVLFGPVFRGIAADVASLAPPGTDVLEVGCGPGHLAIRMAGDHGLRVTASDLDPAMVARARANVDRAFAPGDARRPACVEADVAALPFAEASFDVVVSTFSMHHWADPSAGVAELHRVLRPGGRALVWDFSSRIRRLEGRAPDPVDVAARSPFGGAVVRSWPRPLRFARLAERVELRRAPEPAFASEPVRAEDG